MTVVFFRISWLTIRLDAIALAVGDGLKVHEVESQPIGGDQGPCLLDVRAEDLPEGRVQQVRRRVIPARGIANLCVDFGGHEIPDFQRPRVTCTRCARGRPAPRRTSPSTTASAWYASL